MINPAGRLDQALALLRAEARPDQLQAMAGFGLSGEGRLGLSVPTMRALGKQLGRDHDLALALWDTGIPDAQIVASLVADPQAMTQAQMDHWTQGMPAWDVCDQACLNCFRRSPLAWGCVPRWAQAQDCFTRRAAFSLLAVLAVHDKSAPDARFTDCFALIEQAADDERNFVKKAVNWALRQIGKRNATLLPQAIRVAERLKEQPSKSARWIAADALRELKARAG